MSEELVKSVQDMLKEESWTRAAISNYTKNDMIELAVILEKARQENCVTELKAVCDEHLTRVKDSIIALYISGMLSLKDKNLDNSALVSLVEFFNTNKKVNIVEYLCTTILDEDENNKYALRVLASCYKEENNDKMWDLYERLVKLDFIDFEEADLAKLLAVHYEELGNPETSVDYYKKALQRYVYAKNATAVTEIWKKLVEKIPEETDFFLLIQKEIARLIDKDKSALLMQDLYEWYKKEKKWDTAIDFLKLILQIDSKDKWARREIVDCYRGKYEGHTHLEDYIRASDLTQEIRNVFDAINDFEKHIAFDVKNFVFHKTWGVGKIRKVENDSLTIQFSSGKKEMSLKMAVNALTPLAKDHIWVYKATKAKPELVAMVKNNKKATLEIIIKSFGNKCDFKKIKAELVPSILTASEWTSWNSEAKKILENDPAFGVNPDDINQYIVREKEIRKEEKLANEFKAQKLFFSRIDIIMKYVNDKETEKENELFRDMYQYFVGFTKTVTKVTEQVMASYLVIQSIKNKFPELDKKINQQPEKYTFQQLYSDIDDPREMYELLKDTKNTSLKKDFIRCIRMLPDWEEQYIRIFPTVLQADLLTELVDSGAEDRLKKFAANVFENYKDFREAVLYMFENCQNDEWFKNSGVSYERQLIVLLNIIELTFREINNHLNSTENKKINKQATLLLFKNDTLVNYMFSKDEDTVTKMYTLVDDIQDIEQKIKTTLRSRIMEKYPDYKFHTTEEKTATPKGMLVTAKKKEEKEALLEKIQKVDIPANAAEIAEARAQGDLKENAEYKAAKEHQHYLNVTLTKLQEQLNRAVVFDPTTVTTAMITFATTVTLLNKDTNQEEEYTILGPWESDPDNKILSYMSPFGNALMDKKLNEDVSFEINEHRYNYKVTAIKLAKI